MHVCQVGGLSFLENLMFSLLVIFFDRKFNQGEKFNGEFGSKEEKWNSETKDAQEVKSFPTTPSDHLDPARYVGH